MFEARSRTQNEGGLNGGCCHRNGGEITGLLRSWSAGDHTSLDKVMAMVYEELRRTARHYLGVGENDATMRPTALINEVYLGLVRCERPHFDNRAMFFGFAGQLIRQILVKYARNRMALKRGKGFEHVSLGEEFAAIGGKSFDPAVTLALDEALTRLEAVDPRKCRIIELRFFAGLSVEETAEILRISPRTVKSDWRVAKQWLAHELKGSPESRSR